jgi:hypothetical protein
MRSLPSPQDSDEVPAPIEFKNGDQQAQDAFKVLSNVRSENAWLANFGLQNTQIEA